MLLPTGPRAGRLLLTCLGPQQLRSTITTAAATAAAAGPRLCRRYLWLWNRRRDGAAATSAPSVQALRPVQAAASAAQQLHGIEWHDPYAFLKHTPEKLLRKHLTQELRHTTAALKDVEGLRRQLQAEIDSHSEANWQDSQRSRYRDYEYFSLRDGEHRVDMRQKVDTDARSLGDAHAVLDHRKAAKLFGSSMIGSLQVSPDQQLAVCLVDKTGADDVCAYVFDIATSHVREVVENVFSVAWAADSATLLYTSPDAQRRPFALYSHRLGHPQSEDALLYQEKDSEFLLDVGRTKDEAFFTINVNSKTSSEVYLLPCDQPHGTPVLIHPRSNFSYFVEHQRGSLYIVTNADGAVNFKVVQTPAHAPTKDNWRDFVPHSDSASIVEMEIFASHCCVFRRDLASNTPFLSTICLTTGEQKQTALPKGHAICDVSPHSNTHSAASVAQFSSSSPLLPFADWTYNLSENKLTLAKEQTATGKPSLDMDNYTCYQVNVPGIDGAGQGSFDIPMTLVHRKDMRQDGTSPVLLRCYGSYGINLDLGFYPMYASLLARGWTIALCHVRGGSERGPAWATQARKGGKQRTVDDVLRCATYLVDNKYTQPKLLAGYAISAGGFAIAAACNQRPDLFGAAVLRVPFVDVLGSMVDAELPLTSLDYEEWGNPVQSKDDLESLLKICPYTNLKAQPYPDMLLTCSDNDYRVQYWQVLKYAAKLRECASNRPRVLFWPNVHSHFAHSAEDAARELAFLIQTIQMRGGDGK
eukprot:m.139252 g.139252  ORF g.139252 m.139252 type:complete len:755 (-) comp16652_c1_seq4:837-3101(-)